MNYYIVTTDNGFCIKLVKEGGIILLIPPDPANTDYRAYLAWVAEGNTAEEWQPATEVAE
jgi:hypothetical protein